ncbi:HIT-like protein [Trichodelitschia bisporula]|uniref:HIT-like protein n=1 Tax=Trichodelitschia bisporula TaxID=703511 RepID=A0A6G1I011_9PEZI|nr:HIT-like protein [Trichodelitschia bisporula]
MPNEPSFPGALAAAEAEALDNGTQGLDAQYPQSCPFCNIASAYAAPFHDLQAGPDVSTPDTAVVPEPSITDVPEVTDSTAVDPECFLVLSGHNVVAFLDIMPMTRGHLLVCTRAHRPKLTDITSREGRDIGFWLPILARAVTKVTNVSDYNIVQNNGERAAQVVPHVHFHIIPRPETAAPLSHSWRMFGRGQREDMDEAEGVGLARELREQVRRELRAVERSLL